MKYEEGNWTERNDLACTSSRQTWNGGFDVEGDGEPRTTCLDLRGVTGGIPLLRWIKRPSMLLLRSHCGIVLLNAEKQITIQIEPACAILLARNKRYVFYMSVMFNKILVV
jgi:hypothetical protein